MKKLSTYIAAIALAAVSASAAFAENVVVLRSTASLYEAKDSKTVKWSSDITAGTVLDNRTAGVVQRDIYTKDKTWKDVSFYPVRYNGKDYFIQTRDSAAVEAADRVAVITTSAVLFTKQHPATFRNAWLETGTIVAMEEEAHGVFTKITFFDTDDGVRRTRNVLSSKLSASAGDIKAVQLLEKARTMKDESLQKDFLDSAAKAAESDIITRYIQAETNPLLGKSAFTDDDIVQIDEFSARIYTADGAKVNLRSMPGTAGDKVEQVENGWECIATLATEPKESIEGLTRSWYYVHGDGIEGWVFGGYLQRDEYGPGELEPYESEESSADLYDE